MESALNTERLYIKLFLLISWIAIFIIEVTFIAMYYTVPLDFNSKTMVGIPIQFLTEIKNKNRIFH